MQGAVIHGPSPMGHEYWGYRAMDERRAIKTLLRT
jgi:hypothetical protein